MNPFSIEENPSQLRDVNVSDSQEDYFSQGGDANLSIGGNDCAEEDLHRLIEGTGPDDGPTNEINYFMSNLIQSHKSKPHETWPVTQSKLCKNQLPCRPGKVNESQVINGRRVLRDVTNSLDDPKFDEKAIGLAENHKLAKADHEDGDVCKSNVFSTKNYALLPPITGYKDSWAGIIDSHESQPMEVLGSTDYNDLIRDAVMADYNRLKLEGIKKRAKVNRDENIDWSKINRLLSLHQADNISDEEIDGSKMSRIFSLHQAGRISHENTDWSKISKILPLPEADNISDEEIDWSKIIKILPLPQTDKICDEEIDWSKPKYRPKQDKPVILMTSLPPSSFRRVLDQNPHASTASRCGSKKRDQSREILKTAIAKRQEEEEEEEENLHQANSVKNTPPEPPKPVKNQTTPDSPEFDIAKNLAQLKKILSNENDAVSYILDLNSIIGKLTVALSSWSSFAENMPREMNNFSMVMTLNGSDPQLSTPQGPVQKLQHSIYEHFISPGRGTPTNNTDPKKYEAYSDFIEKTINILSDHGLLDQKG